MEGSTDEDAPRRQQAQEYGAVRYGAAGKLTSEHTRIDLSVPERQRATGGKMENRGDDGSGLVVGGWCGRTCVCLSLRWSVWFWVWVVRPSCVGARRFAWCLVLEACCLSLDA
jgi:hypothetical protein